MKTEASRSALRPYRCPPPRRPGALALIAAAGGLCLLGCTGSIAGGNDRPGGGAEEPGPGNGSSKPGKGNGSGSNGNGNGMTPGDPGNPGDPGSGMGMTPGNPGSGMSLPGVPGDDYKGPKPLRRLTRSQYNNSVRDLLGLVGDFAAVFGIDEQDGAFASNNEAPLTEVQVERYQQVAEDLADKAVANLDRIVPCSPPKMPEAACVDQLVRNLGKRAFRRPLTETEVTRWKALFDSGRQGGDFSSGVSLVIAGLLQNPNFLYLVEVGDGKPAVGGRLALTSYEVGTRLSYFLLNSTPDPDLLAAADAGKLTTAADIATQARRLLALGNARDTMTSFYAQWLDIDDLLTVEKDAKAYPLYNPTVRAGLRDDVLEFTDQVTRMGDGRLATLLTAKYTFLRGPVYPVYGLPMQGNAGGSILHRVDLPAGERAGVFTLAGVLAKHGHADQSSPVARGLLVSDRLLCVTPAPPPPGVDNNVPAVDPNVPTRQRFEMHRSKPQCAACHDLMDPLGVAFEIYDGIGHYRTTDGGKSIDSATMLSGTKSSDGPIKDALDLMTKLSTTEEVRACVARQMYRYAIGRMETKDDEPSISEALTAFGKTDYKITDLMVAIASTPAFRTRAVPEL